MTKESEKQCEGFVKRRRMSAVKAESMRSRMEMDVLVCRFCLDSNVQLKTFSKTSLFLNVAEATCKAERLRTDCLLM